MERIRVIIEKAPHNYAAYMPDIDGIVTTAKTLGKTITNMYEAINVAVDFMKEIGEEVPGPLQGEYVLTFELAEAPVVHKKRAAHPKSLQVATA